MRFPEASRHVAPLHELRGAAALLHAGVTASAHRAILAARLAHAVVALDLIVGSRPGAVVRRIAERIRAFSLPESFECEEEQATSKHAIASAERTRVRMTPPLAARSDLVKAVPGAAAAG